MFLPPNLPSTSTRRPFPLPPFCSSEQRPPRKGPQTGGQDSACVLRRWPRPLTLRLGVAFVSVLFTDDL